MNPDGNSLPTRSTPANFTAHPAIFAALAALLIYAVTLHNTFAYDFYAITKDDTHLLHPAQWGFYWHHAYNGGVDNLYRPLTSTFLAAESWLFGIDASDAWKFHLISWLLHAACCALVAEFARRLTTNNTLALLTGLLYAVHPIHVEVLGDIVGQAELLCTLGILGSLILFLGPSPSPGTPGEGRGEGRISPYARITSTRIIAIFFCFILAVLTKESGMLLPFLLLLLALTLRRPTPTEKQPMQLLAILLCFTLGAYIVLREHLVKFEWDRTFLDPVINPLVLSHGKDRILMPIVLIGHYLQLLLLPYKLSPDYSGAAIGSIARLNDPYFWLGLFAIVLWCASTLTAFLLLRRLRRRESTPIPTLAAPLLFCLLSLAITYALIGNLLLIIGTNFAERLMYLPSIFFLLILATALSKLPKNWMIAITTVLILLASFRTITYASRWNDRLTLYEHAAHDQPGAVRLDMLLAAEQADRGNNVAALQTLRTAQQQTPNYTELWDFSAALAIRMKEFDLAEQFLKRSNALGPTLRSTGLQQQLIDARSTATQPTSQQN